MVTLIIPFYNEQERIPLFHEKLQSYLANNQHISHIFMVNDGSQDETFNLLENIQQNLRANYPSIEAKVIDLQKNQGKGGALRAGILQTTTAWALTTDADFATPPQQLDQWITTGQVDLTQKTRVYIGSREMGIRAGLVHFHWHRRIIGRIFAFLVWLFTGVKDSDTQCGFKLYPTVIAKAAFEPLVERGYAHDVEVLYRIHQKKVPIQSLPLQWEDQEGSKVNLLVDSFKMLIAIVKMRSYIK